MCYVTLEQIYHCNIIQGFLKVQKSFPYENKSAIFENHAMSKSYKSRRTGSFFWIYDFIRKRFDLIL